MVFSRTPSGLASEYLFFKDEVLVYVEGHTDIPFYKIVLDNYNCRIRTYSEETGFDKLVEGLIKRDLHYVIILDGHYEILTCKRSVHRRVILLHRHSSENYLIEEAPVDQFRHNRSPLKDSLEKLENSFSEIVIKTEQYFTELLVLDVASKISNSGYKVLPKGADDFFVDNKTIDFDDTKIQKISNEAKMHIDQQSIENARTLVQEYLKNHRVIDILPGHFAFSIIRCWINRTTNVRKRILEEDIRTYLSSEVWRSAKTRDHNSLKRRLRNAVREAERMRKVSRN